MTMTWPIRTRTTTGGTRLMFMRIYAQRIAERVLAPDYYQGPWRVLVGSQAKTCPSYDTARAWANYLTRRGFRMISLSKV